MNFLKTMQIFIYDEEALYVTGSSTLEEDPVTKNDKF